MKYFFNKKYKSLQIRYENNPSLKMSVIAKSQNNTIAAKPTNYSVSSKQFTYKMKDLIAKVTQSRGKENKMRFALEVFQTINREINQFLQDEKMLSMWVKFLCTILDKIITFETEYRNGEWHLINEEVVETFNNELEQTKQFVIDIIKNYKNVENFDVVLKAKDKITALEAERPRRNIKRVNYRYMDTLEPICKDNMVVNDIWADATISKDPDYVFEEDKDDDEEKQKKEDKKQSTELSIKEKTKLKNNLDKLINRYRVKRSLVRSKYEADMSEEDECYIHITKRRYQNGKPKYIWKSYSLYADNENEDE